MARTSKKQKMEKNIEAANALSHEKIYSAAVYARLSVDDPGDYCNGINESMESQIEIIKAFLETQNDMILFDKYIDLGKTGTHFDRDEFNRLMTDVRLRKVDCIIVKDFSRLGREYIETANYIQKIFPFLGVRFIAVSDNFDSLYSDVTSLEIDLKNLVNELYARDVGIKVKSSKHAQWERGSYTGGIPPYGYTAKWIDGKKCLFAEAVTSAIVKELYDQYESGKGLKALVLWLYERRVHRPTDYHKYGHVFCEGEEILLQWSLGSVRVLLTNPVYMGCLVQAVTCGKEHRFRKKHDIESGDWSVKENTHEAIINQEQFFQIAEKFEKQSIYCNKNGFSKAIPQKEDIFEGILFCGECGSKMKRVSAVKVFSSKDRCRIYGYHCKNSSRIDLLRCEKKYITEETQIRLLKDALKQEFDLNHINYKKLVEKNKDLPCQKEKEEKRKLADIEMKINYRKSQNSEMYLNYRNGDLSKETFLLKKNENEKQILDLNWRMKEQSRRIQELAVVTAQQGHFIQNLVKCNEKMELSKCLLEALISKINIFPDNRVEIVFRYHSDFCGIIK